MKKGFRRNKKLFAYYDLNSKCPKRILRPTPIYPNQNKGKSKACKSDKRKRKIVFNQSSTED